mmetsp:Transcript_7483/g.18329  ORF Transcript_7483/g.18329 Transcript_7483/m.18329 type:complete len:689 (-) Transcript_7483:399-2465(-)
MLPSVSCTPSAGGDPPSSERQGEYSQAPKTALALPQDEGDGSDGSGSEDSGSDDGEALAPDGARALEKELAQRQRPPRSVVDELCGEATTDEGTALDFGDVTKLLLEMLDAADAPASAAAEGASGSESAQGESEAERALSSREQLLAAVRARLFDAQGEALIEVGPISPDRVNACFCALRLLCESEIGGHSQLVLVREAGKTKDKRPRVRLDVLIRLPPSELRHLNLRVAVIGNVDAGKSTLVGVLVGGSLDNGRGSARLRVLKHRHEAETGRTSSIAEDQHIGFDQEGRVVNSQHPAGAHALGGGGGGGTGGASLFGPPPAAEAIAAAGTPGGGMRAVNWQEVVSRSSKVVSFIDLAGHEKYLKTTMFGMTAHDPDYGMVVVGANHGVTRMTKEHLGVAIALHVPVLIVVTKVDLAPENILKETMQQLHRLLRVPGARKRPYQVRGMDDVVVASRAFRDGFVAPIFTISNVTGQDMDLLQTFINLMPARKRWAQRSDGAVEFLIDQFFNVPGIGTVVAGTLVSGVVTVGQTLQLGPDYTGAFKPVLIKSIHCMRTSCQKLLTGQSGAFLMRSLKRKIIIVCFRSTCVRWGCVRAWSCSARVPSQGPRGASAATCWCSTPPPQCAATTNPYSTAETCGRALASCAWTERCCARGRRPRSTSSSSSAPSSSRWARASSSARCFKIQLLL